MCPLGFHGRQCEKEIEVPSTDLTPPKPLEPLDSSTSQPEHEEQQEETSTDLESSARPDTSSPTTEETAEPLGPIVITDPPESQTAGKWPPEPPTDSPHLQFDSENET